jgi:hypothetical protein
VVWPSCRTRIPWYTVGGMGQMSVQPFVLPMLVATEAKGHSRNERGATESCCSVCGRHAGFCDKHTEKRPTGTPQKILHIVCTAQEKM